MDFPARSEVELKTNISILLGDCVDQKYFFANHHYYSYNFSSGGKHLSVLSVLLKYIDK